MSHHPGYKSSSTKTVKVEKDKTYIVWTGGQAVPVYMNGTDELVVPISDIVETVDSFASRAKLENKRVPSRPWG